MFKLTKTSKKSSARLGKIKTAHGDIATPFFMPDATRGCVRALSNEDLRGLKMGPMVVNTYHLYLQPGLEVIKKAGGIHNFMNWNGPLLSDSGGYQVFSLIHKNPKMGKITDKGAIFKSPYDGSTHVLTPEKSIQIQFELGVDMMVCLDDCPPNDFNRDDLEKAVDRTVAWAVRCKKEYDKQIKKRKIKDADQPLIFGVIQGGAELDLRKKCADGLISMNFDGYGFGARPVDVDGNFLREVLKYTADLIPKDKIRFALGIGTPEDIIRCAELGWDIFDCVIPTREARHGRLYAWKKMSLRAGGEAISRDRRGRSSFLAMTTINITNSKYKKDLSAINGDNLKNHSKAYLYHLFKVGEPLALKLATLNNLNFYLGLMAKISRGVREGKI